MSKPKKVIRETQNTAKTKQEGPDATVEYENWLVAVAKDTDASTPTVSTSPTTVRYTTLTSCCATSKVVSPRHDVVFVGSFRLGSPWRPTKNLPGASNWMAYANWQQGKIQLGLRLCPNWDTRRTNSHWSFRKGQRSHRRQPHTASTEALSHQLEVRFHMGLFTQ